MCKRDEIPKHIDIQNRSKHIGINSWLFMLLSDQGAFWNSTRQAVCILGGQEQETCAGQQKRRFGRPIRRAAFLLFL